jgi:hypothetical protein
MGTNVAQHGLWPICPHGAAPVFQLNMKMRWEKKWRLLEVDAIENKTNLLYTESIRNEVNYLLYLVEELIFSGNDSQLSFYFIT